MWKLKKKRATPKSKIKSKAKAKPKARSKRKVGSRRKKNSLLYRIILFFINKFLKLLIYPPILFSLILLLSINFFIYSGLYGNLMSSIDNKIIAVYEYLGFTLKDIYLEGQKHSSDQKLLKSINIRQGTPLFRINIEEIKTNLEKLPWVKYAVVERLYPSTLNIKIVEREPAALWQYKGKIKLIDKEGEVIQEDNLVKYSNLIILVGEDVPAYSNMFFNMIAIDADIASKISSAIRIGKRRWNIRLKNNSEIKLPEQNSVKAWTYLVNLHNEKNILDQAFEYIDLRVEGKAYIKPLAEK